MLKKAPNLARKST